MERYIRAIGPNSLPRQTPLRSGVKKRRNLRIHGTPEQSDSLQPPGPTSWTLLWNTIPRLSESLEYKKAPSLGLLELQDAVTVAMDFLSPCKTCLQNSSVCPF